MINIADRPLAEHFTLFELTASDTAERLGIDNTPSEIIIANLVLVAEALEAARQLLGHPIHVNSGYRCERLNSAIGGARRSRHVLGLAADFIAPAYGAPVAIARALAASLIEFDQLIYEHTWVHLGLAIPGEDPRNEVLTLMPGRHYESGIIDWRARREAVA